MANAGGVEAGVPRRDAAVMPVAVSLARAGGEIPIPDGIVSVGEAGGRTDEQAPVGGAANIVLGVLDRKSTRLNSSHYS
mgnify:CR=1 FL=1